MKKLGLGLLAGFVVMQVIPLGRDHDNPPVVKEPAWNSPATRELARRACFDCHSNETRWPWYSHVAPISWMLSHHVEEGREHLNLSEWNRSQKHAEHAAEEIKEGNMPLPAYVALHAEARLSAEEKEQLARGLEATLLPQGGAEKAAGHHHDHHDHHDHHH